VEDAVGCEEFDSRPQLAVAGTQPLRASLDTVEEQRAGWGGTRGGEGGGLGRRRRTGKARERGTTCAMALAVLCGPPVLYICVCIYVCINFCVD
jgi:hypothetical protein